MVSIFNVYAEHVLIAGNIMIVNVVNSTFLFPLVDGLPQWLYLPVTMCAPIIV